MPTEFLKIHMEKNAQDTDKSRGRKCENYRSLILLLALCTFRIETWMKINLAILERGIGEKIIRRERKG